MSKPLNTIENKIDNAVIKELLQSQFNSSRTKINDDATNMMTELAKLLVVETTSRAILQAKQDQKQDNKVTLNHIEAIIPQLMLDFP